MRVTIRQKNLKITPALTRYIEQKVLKPIRRMLKVPRPEGPGSRPQSGLGKSSGGDLPILDLEFGRASRHHRKGRVFHAEANLTIGKKLLRAEIDGEDMRLACDALQEELESAIRTYNGKRRSMAKREGREAKRQTRFHPASRP